jgi:hypothetical protein
VQASLENPRVARRIPYTCPQALVGSVATAKPINFEKIKIQLQIK